MSKESLISVKKIRDILNEMVKDADWECTGGLYVLGKQIEPHLVKIESDLNELIMADMTHEYNEAEAERFRPEFARQILAHAMKEDYSIFFDAIKALPEEDKVAIDNYFSEYYITEMDNTERVFPKDFFPNIRSVAGRVMCLWQLYEAEVNKNKYLSEQLQDKQTADPVAAILNNITQSLTNEQRQELYDLLGYRVASPSPSDNSSNDSPLREALEKIRGMKVEPNEDGDHRWAFNRCWHIADKALNIDNSL